MHITGSRFRRTRNVAISLVYDMACRIWRALARLAGVQDTGRCVVICYHSVLPEERTAFWRQMDELVKMTTPVKADVMERLAPGVLYTAITFDDAFSHVVLSVLPQLAARGIPATLFVPTGHLGKGATWYQTPQCRDRAETVATANELRMLPADLILIGSHGVNHKDMRLLSRQEAEWELRESRATLEDILERPVTTFAFPYAKFNAALVDQSRAAGYRRVFTGQPRREPMDEENYVVGRVRVDPTDTLIEFRLKVRGAYGWLPALSGMKQRLVRLVGFIKTKGRHNADFTSAASGHS